MDQQAVFNKVAAHLLSQNARSWTGPGNCYYRSPDGLKCAIGCLIDDKFYSVSLEGFRPGNPLVRQALIDSGIDIRDDGDIIFLKKLQHIHDDAKSPIEEWKEKLKDFANLYQLEFQ